MLGVKWEPTTSFTHMPGPYWVEVTDLTSCENVRQSSICQKNIKGESFYRNCGAASVGVTRYM